MASTIARPYQTTPTPGRRRVVPRARQLPLVLFMAAVPAIAADPSPARAGNADPADRFFSQDDVPRISLEIAPAAMETLRAYEFRRDGNRDGRTNVAVTVREGDKTYTNVAVHLKGSLGSFRDIDDRPALTLTFDKWAEGQRFHGLKKISLNNSVQDWSYASEIVSRELFRAAGLPCPRAAHALVSLNGRDLGLYVVLEGWNKQFLQRHFPDPRGSLWDCGTARDITADLDHSGDGPEDRTLLDRLAAASRETNLTVRLDRMAEVLDLDRFFTFIAGEVMLMHWDGYAMNRNNYRVFHDRSSNRLVFLPQGLDQMFGQFRNWRPTSSIRPMMKGLVARAAVQAPAGRRRYLEAMERLLNTVYDVPRLTSRVDTITAKLQKALEHDLGTRARQMGSAAALKDRIIRRAASVREQLATESSPVQFGPDNTVSLTKWTSSSDSGSPTFRRQATPVETLEINAPNRRAYGSWRTEVYLDEGRYQLTGRLKLVDARFDSGTNALTQGASLRLSGDREARMIRQAPDWQTVTYEFNVSGQEDLLLVCEYRAIAGTALFDASSLRLIRLSGPRRP